MKKRYVGLMVAIVMALSAIPTFAFAADNTRTSLDAPKLESYSSGSRSITSQWAKVKGAEKYQLYRAETKNGKYINIWTTWQNSYKDTKIKANKTYYYKIRAYKTQNGKKVYSKFSPVLTAKACGAENINIGYKVKQSSSKSKYIVATITNKSNYPITIGRECVFYSDIYSHNELTGTLYKASNDKAVSPKQATVKPGRQITLKYQMSQPVKATNKTLFGFSVKFQKQSFGMWLCNEKGWSVES